MIPAGQDSSTKQLQASPLQNSPSHSLTNMKNKPAFLQWSHTTERRRTHYAFASISLLFPGYLSTYALSPSRSPFKVNQPSLPSQFSLPLPITLRIAALAFPFHFSPTLSTCGP